MRLTETCSCGASIDVADQWPVSVARRLFEFRAAHEPCRQPPQARQANTGPTTMTYRYGPAPRIDTLRRRHRSTTRQTNQRPEPRSVAKTLPNKPPHRQRWRMVGPPRRPLRPPPHRTHLNARSRRRRSRHTTPPPPPKDTHMTAKPIPADELRDAGYLQEVNRQFFHPLGLALVVEPKLDALTIHDLRATDTGVFFTEEQLNTPEAETKAMRIANELGQRSAARIDACGAVIQSIPTTLRTWTTITAPDPTGRKTQIRTIIAWNTPTPPDDATITRESWEKASDGTWERTILEWEPPATETIDPTAPTTPGERDNA